ncbi:Flp family type IVb pilin [Paraburkholderia xenovorans]|uniref:Flp family type IVb pilin n=1 Tax=Paraburkholderia xenovorans TaxID=36873 RepID=UPI0038BCC0DE
MKKFTLRFLRENKGVTAIEYGLIAGLIVVIIAASVTNIGTGLRTVFTNVVTAITPAAPAA